MASFRVLGRLIGLLVLLGGGAPAVRADLAADLARVSVEAAGGADAHRRLAGLRAIGTARVGGREASFILHAQRPRRLRVESIGETGSLVRAFDGEKAPWRRDDPRSPPRRLGRAEERDFLLDADFDSPLHDHVARGIGLDPAGEVEIGGKAYQKLLAVLRHTELVTLYIDAETYLLARRDQRRRVGGRDVIVETHYSDFRPVAGVLLPWRIVTIAEGRELSDVRIEAMDANPELPPDFFAPPAADWPRL
jgi:hypothetical protein